MEILMDEGVRWIILKFIKEEIVSYKFYLVSNIQQAFFMSLFFNPLFLCDFKSETIFFLILLHVSREINLFFIEIFAI